VLWTTTDIRMGLRFDKAFIARLMKGVPGMNLRESVTYQAILEEGREEGRIEAYRETLLRQATRRFGAPDEPTRARVEAMADEAQLEALLDRVLDAAGWVDLLAGLP
jgi:hypothetical protein